MINIVSGAVKNGPPKHLSCMGRGIPKGLHNKISQACPIFMINRARLKFKNQSLLRLQVITSCQVKYGVHTYIN